MRTRGVKENKYCPLQTTAVNLDTGDPGNLGGARRMRGSGGVCWHSPQTRQPSSEACNISADG